MNIDSIVNGIVIDHITAGRGKEIYNLLHLSNLDCMVALITNAASVKMGRKDIIKIAESIELDTDALGYVDPGVTVSIICDGKTIEKKKLDLPLELEGVLHCKNPRCITSTEQELAPVFKLTDRTKREYRCIYCESKF
ncbi:MAG: aspartate carbamoyltransferase regulatory subunit [Oscillospiraceae bacterium]|nr:aspartate carbamoyltransferase regulatory subunit [Oscillospiraceae bacterium]